MSKEIELIAKRAEDEIRVSQLAAQCIDLVEAAGGLGCTKLGLRRVITRMNTFLENGATDGVKDERGSFR